MFAIIVTNIGPILDQLWPYIQLHWAMLGFPYWANIAPMQWPYIGPMSKLHWAYVGCQCWPIISANIGPTLALYATKLGHAWLPILGQHCANAVDLYWANEQTALGLGLALNNSHTFSLNDIYEDNLNLESLMKSKYNDCM